MVIFHSYVKLPEDIHDISFPDKNDVDQNDNLCWYDFLLLRMPAMN